MVSYMIGQSFYYPWQRTGIMLVIIKWIVDTTMRHGEEIGVLKFECERG